MLNEPKDKTPTYFDEHTFKAQKFVQELSLPQDIDVKGLSIALITKGVELAIENGLLGNVTKEQLAVIYLIGNDDLQTLLQTSACNAILNIIEKDNKKN